MTGFMHEKEFSRALVRQGRRRAHHQLLRSRRCRRGIGGDRQHAVHRTRPATTSCRICTQVDSWIAITTDNKIIVTHGEPEFAGTPTGILMLVAEELNADMEHDGLRASGDLAERHRRRRRLAAASRAGRRRPARRLRTAKQVLLSMASTKLGVPVASLTVANGVISGGGSRSSTAT